MPKRSLPAPLGTSIKAKSLKSSSKAIKDRGASSSTNTGTSSKNTSKEQSLSLIQQGTCDNVSDRYVKLGRRLGHGTYGIVYQAKDLQTGQLVALKRCIPHHEASDGFPITTLREIQTLKICAGHPHIVQLQNVAVSRSGVFLVFEYCEHDLSNVIDRHFTTFCKSPFIEPQIKTLTIHLLQALDFMHSRHMIHRDIKLSNLLYTDRGCLKLADFGLSRPYADAFQSQLTPQVASLWYRPPELLLGGTTYTTSIDMWGVACIIGELVTGEPLMRGQTELEQIHAIFDCVGLPDPDYAADFPLIQSGKLRLPKKSRRTLLDVLGDRLSMSGLNLVHSLLRYDPKERWTSAKALQSPYLLDELPSPTPAEKMPRFPQSFRS